MCGPCMGMSLCAGNVTINQFVSSTYQTFIIHLRHHKMQSSGELIFYVKYFMSNQLKILYQFITVFVKGEIVLLDMCLQRLAETLRWEGHFVSKLLYKCLPKHIINFNFVSRKCELLKIKIELKFAASKEVVSVVSRTDLTAFGGIF